MSIKQIPHPLITTITIGDEALTASLVTEMTEIINLQKRNVPLTASCYLPTFVSPQQSVQQKKHQSRKKQLQKAFHALQAQKYR